MGIFLKRVSQIGFGIETTEAVAATNATPTDSDPSYIVDTSVVNPYQRRYRDAEASIEFTETDVTRDKASLTPDVTVKGPGKFKSGWTEDMAGGAIDKLGTWGPPLRACGFEATVGTGARKITIDTPSAGSFAAGQRIGDNTTEGSATKTGLVIAVATIAGVITVWYKAGTGTFADGDTLYNYGQGTQGVAEILTNPASGGHRFYLQTETGSTTPKSGTCEMRDGEMVVRGVGCRGNAVFNLGFGEVPSVAFTFEGPAQLKNEDKDPLLAAFVSSVPDLAAPTLVVGDVTGAGVPFVIDNFGSFVMTQMSIDVGTQLAERRTIAAGGALAYLAEGTRCGYAATRITARQPTATIDPEYPANATYELFQRYAKGATFPVIAQIGALRTAGNQAIVLYSPKGQFAGNLQKQERDGIVTFSGQVRLAGSIDDELEIYHLFA